MQPHSEDVKELQTEIDELRARLSEAEQSLRATAGSGQRDDRVVAANDNEDAYRAHILENMSDAMIVTDERFVVAYRNRAAEAIYGWRAEEAVGRSLPEVVRTERKVGDAQSEFRLLEQMGQWRGKVTQGGLTTAYVGSLRVVRQRPRLLLRRQPAHRHAPGRSVAQLPPERQPGLHQHDAGQQPGSRGRNALQR